MRWPAKKRVRVKRVRPHESGYIEWSKAHGHVLYNLAVSGVPPCDIALLDPSLDDFTMVADNEYGWPPLIERIAAGSGMDAADGVNAGRQIDKFIRR